MIAWDDEAARAELVDALVGDAQQLLGHLPDRELDARVADAVVLLALLAGQDVEPAADSDGTGGRWRIARRVAPDRVISTVDPRARHSHKSRSRRQDGYKAHVVVEPDTGIITDTALTPAAGPDNSDATVGIDLLAGTARTGTGPTGGWEVLADSAHTTGDALAAPRNAGHTPIIKPWPPRPAVEGGFTLDDVTVIEPRGDQLGAVTCPNGVTRPITPTRNVIFGAACRGCPPRARRTTRKTGRSLTLHPHDAVQRAHRARAQDPDFQTVYRRHRPMVERSTAWLVAGGNRRPRFRGTALNDLWLHHRVAALNLRRLLTLGLTRTDGAWRAAAG